MPFGVVAVQQAVRCPAADLGGQFPAKVERVLDAEVEALPSGRRVDVRRVTGQKHPSGPVALGQPGGIAEAGEPARGVHAEVGTGECPQLLLELVERGRDRAVIGHPLGGHDDAVRPVPGGPEAEPQLGLADLAHHGGHRLRRSGHLHLAQQRLDPAGLTRETDAEQFAHRAAAAVAAHQVARAQQLTTGQLDGHTAPVRTPVTVLGLAQPDHCAAAPDLDAELGGVLGQQAVGEGLRDAEDIAVCGVQPVGCRFADGGEEAAERILLAFREEPLQQAALVHHLDAARVQAERADIRGRRRFLLQHEHLYPVQPQLGGQHHAGRSAAGNDHVDHHNPQFRPR